MGSNHEGCDHGSIAASNHCCNGHRTAGEVVEECLQFTGRHSASLHDGMSSMWKDNSGDNCRLNIALIMLATLPVSKWLAINSVLS